MGWPMVPLCNALTLNLDAVPVDPEGHYSFMGIFGFGRGAIDRGCIQGSELSATTLYRVRSGQFIYSRLKAFEGAFTIVPSNFDGRVVSNEFPTFDLDQSLVLPSFLRWYFRRPATWTELSVGSKGIGARRERLSPSLLLTHQMPLPPRDEQRRIVARLDRVTDRIEARRERVIQAEADLQSLLSKAFAHAIDGAPRRPMAEVAPLVRRPVGIEPTASYPELGVRSFGRGTFHKPVLIGADLSWQKLFRIESGDLVFSNIKAWEGAIAVAGAQDHGRVGSHRYLTCVANPSLTTPDFLWFYLQTHEGLAAVQAASPGSADRNRTLGVKKLQAIQVPIPPLETQRWFNRLQAKARQIRAIRQRTAEDADALIPALLHEVFNGPGQAA